MRLQNWLLFATVVVLWGSNWPVMKIGLGFVPPVTFVLHRFLVSAAVLLPAVVLFRKRVPRDRSTLLKLFGLCLIFTAIIVTQALGLFQESSGIASVLTYTQPLFVFCLAVPFLAERITSVKVLGVVVGFGGVVVLFLGRLGAFPVDSILTMLLGAFLWAVSVLYYKKFLAHVDPFVTHFMQMAVGSVFLSMYVFGVTGFAVSTDMNYVVLLLVSASGALAAGNVIWFYLLQKEEATTLSGSSLIIPVVAMFSGWLILNESLYLASVVGAALTLFGVYLVNFRRKERSGIAVQFGDGKGNA